MSYDDIDTAACTSCGLHVHELDENGWCNRCYTAEMDHQATLHVSRKYGIPYSLAERIDYATETRIDAWQAEQGIKRATSLRVTSFIREIVS